MTSHWRSKSRPERRPMILVILGMICLVAGSALSAEHKYDGVYTGKRSLTKGTPSGTCPAVDDVSITITGETLTFTNSRLTNFLMPFEPGPDGSFSHTITQGDAAPDYHGRIIGDVMNLDTDDLHCEYHWHLTRFQAE